MDPYWHAPRNGSGYYWSGFCVRCGHLTANHPTWIERIIHRLRRH